MIITLAFYISTQSFPNKKKETMRRNKLMGKKKKKKNLVCRVWFIKRKSMPIVRVGNSSMRPLY